MKINKKELSKFVGEKVRSIRLARNLTQVRLAEKTNISQNFLSCIEIGTTQISLYDYLVIVEALGVHPDDFLPEEVVSTYGGYETCQVYEDELYNYVTKRKKK